MHLAEIIVLIAGAVLFTVSFFMPDKNSGATVDKEESKELIKELLDKEMSNARFQIEEAAEECVNDNKDKMERALDKITNEKMMAVDEYSNTVLEQIHKNHEEAMFLYDMLNNKHSQVKNTAAEINQLSKSVKAVAETVEEKVAEPALVKPEPVKSKVEPIKTPVLTMPEPKPVEAENFEAIKPKEIASIKEAVKKAEKPVIEEIPVFEETAVVEELPVEKKLEVIDISSASVKKKNAKSEKKERTPIADANLDLMFASDNNSANNNDRILALHKAGKSNMAIAKELGLGIGEVKLVIDLFEGI